MSIPENFAEISAHLTAELHQARNLLDGRTSFLDAVLDSLDTGIVACDADGVLTLFNRATREFHGVDQLALPFEAWGSHYDLYLADGTTRMPTDEIPLVRALNGEIVRNVEMVIAPKKGARRLVLNSGRAIFDKDGKKLGAVVAMQDITDQKSATDRIRSSERFLESIVENIPNMLFVKDAKDLRFVRFNRAGEEMMGVGREDLIGKNDFDFFTPDQAEAFTAKDREVLRGGQVIEIPEELLVTPTQTRTIRTKKIPILDEQGVPRYLLGISEDITLRKELEKQQSMNVELKEEKESRELFVNTLSHDLRNPLAAAKTSAELLRRYPDKVDARERLTNRIVSSIERADKMIQDLLDANSIRAGEKLTFERSSVNLVEVAANSVEELSVLYGERFSFSSPHELYGYWNGDSLRRLIENLCSNAVKYGTIDKPITVTLESLPARDEVQLTVHNFGQPIPEAELPELFKSFQRSRAARASTRPGWGLGLVLVSGITEAHRGSVRVESSERAGTSFIITLPRDSR